MLLRLLRDKMKLKIKIKPNSLKEEVKKTGDREYQVSVKKPAKDDKANIALIKILKNYFKSPVEIKSGFKSRNKIVELCEK